MTEKQTTKLQIIENYIAIITLTRPEVANALNSQMALELKDIFSNLPRNIRAAILTGEGERAFCAGADLKERNNMRTQDWQVQHQKFRHVLQSIMECQIPVIAAVNGAAYGGGLELALACDFIYASENAHFALPEATLGIMPGMGGTQNLPRAIGIRMAKELLFTGKSFTAKEALSFGMINKICPQGLLLEQAIFCAKNIITNAPLSVAAIKRAINQASHLSMEEALFVESGSYNRLLSTADRNEGINAFNEKRKPSFKGN